MQHQSRLRCSRSALRDNYRAICGRTGVPVAAAIKANAYGLGAPEVAKILWEEGCRDFLVATPQEAREVGFLPPQSLSVLHGSMTPSREYSRYRLILNSVQQVEAWKSEAPADLSCDVMVNTGMNRLGIDFEEISVLEGLCIDTLHSHLASADEESPQNDEQLVRFREFRTAIKAARYSLANSAGVFLGADYHFDLVRPGLSLYGGIPVAAAADVIRPIASIEAEVIQVRTVRAGESVGYNATWRAPELTKVAIVNLGYADGYKRAFSNRGDAIYDGQPLHVLGRVSMDLTALDVSNAPDLKTGAWVEIPLDLQKMEQVTGVSQYEMLTGLGRRLDRYWV